MKEKEFRKGIIKRLLSVVLVVAMVISPLPMNNGTVAYAADDGDYIIYIPAFNTDGKSTSEVSKVNITKGIVEKTIEVGHTSLSLVEDANGFVYVSNGNSPSISVIDSSTDTVIKTITISGETYFKGITIDPAMENLYIATQSGAGINSVGRLYAYNIETGTPSIVLSCYDSFYYCAVTEDFIYVVYTPTKDYGKRVCARYSFENGMVDKTVDIPLVANYGNLSPDGSKYAIVTGRLGSTNESSIIIVDTDTMTIEKEITLSKGDAYYNWGMFVDYSKDGKYIYALSQIRANGGGDTGRLSIFDANTYDLKSTMNFDADMISAGVGKDANTLLLLPNPYSGNKDLRIIDVSDATNPQAIDKITLTTKAYCIGPLTPSSYTQNKIKEAQHQHNFVFSVAEDGKTIEAYCNSAEGGENCPYYAESYDAANGKLVTLTLEVTNPTYGDSDIAPTITYGGSDEQAVWTGNAKLKIPETEGAPVTKTYYEANESGEKTSGALETTPEGVGKYVVEVNVSFGEGKDVTVALPYDINKASQDAPTADKFDTASTIDTVSVVPKSDDATVYEYSIDGGSTWESSGVFTDLSDAEKYTIQVRVKETDTHEASPALSLDLYTKAKTPESASEGATVNNSTETITIKDGYEVSTTDDFASTIENGGTVTPDTTYYVRKKGIEGGCDPSASVPFTTPERAAKPATPVLDKKSDVSITITPVEGVEYSINGTDWNTTGIFTGLNPSTPYTVKARVKATEEKFASEAVTLSVTTKNSAPATPTEDKFNKTSTENSISITKKNEEDTNVYEYSIDDGTTWVNSGVFTGLTDATKYDVLVRIKETEDTVASDPLTITKYTLAKTPASASEGATVNNSTETITIKDGYEVSTTDDFASTIENGGTVTPDTTYYIRKKGIEGGCDPSASVPFTTPERGAKPSAPELESKTDVSIKVIPVEGVEYSIDGTDWNTTGTFTGLTIDTPYTIRARKQATETEFCSEESTLEVRTWSHDEKAFDEYKKLKAEEIKNLLLEKDLPVIDELIEEAIKAINETEYNPEKTLEENKAGIDAIVSKAKEDIKTEWQKAPAGLDKVDPSKRRASDGKIIGVDSTMEYSTDGGNTWKAVEPDQTEITGLPIGEIEIRRKAVSEDRPVSESITFILEKNDEGTYQVIYHVDGGVKVVVDDTVYVKGSVAQILFAPVPEKEGYEFLGWSEFSIATNPTYTAKGSTTLTIGEEDVNLFAVWRKVGVDSAKEPLITEDLKGIETEKGKDAKLTIQVEPEDDGVISYAWYRCDTPYEYPNGQLIEGATENTFKVPTDIGKASYYYVVVTNTKGEETAHVISKLAPVYVEDKGANHYKVEFVINGEDVCTSYERVIHNALIVEPAEPDVAGFAGWYKDAECTDMWNFAKDTVTAYTRIYAKHAETVYVTYLANGGQFKDGTPEPDCVEVGSKIAEPNYTLTNKNHMVFSGWFKDSNATDAWDFTVDRVYKNLTLYAGWGYPVGIENEPELSVGKVGDYIYTGKQIKPEVIVSYGGRVLVRNVDYTVSYKNNVKVRTGIENNNLVVSEEDGSIIRSDYDAKAPSIIIKGKRNYSNKKINLNFNIVPINLGKEGTTMMDAGVASDITTKYAVNKKSAIKVKGNVTYNKKKLKVGRDYTATIYTVDAKDKEGKAVEAGTVLTGQKIPKGSSGTFMLTVEGKNNYSGGFYKIITVESGTKTLQKAKISLKKIPYNDADLTAADLVEKGKLTVKVNGNTLKYDEDYTVSFAEKNMKPGSRKNGGVYPITITGKGEYDGSRMTNAVITGMPIKKASITLKEAKPVYTGSHIGNNIDKVTIAGPDNTTKTLYAGIDYDVKVTNDIKAGTARVTITGKGIYAGSKKVTYKIQKKEITTDMVKSHEVKEDGTVDLGKHPYFNGYAVQPKIELEYEDMTLIRPTDYAMTYTNNRKAGSKATATIVGKGNYTGSIKATFQVEDNKIDSNKKSIKKAKVKVYKQTYTGRDITLNQESFKTIKVKVKGKYETLVLGKDFEIVEESYRRNVDVSKSRLASVTIHGIGDKFDGYKSISFRITKKDLKWWTKPELN